VNGYPIGEERTNIAISGVTVGQNHRSKRSLGCSRSRKKSFLRMRGTTVPRKEQNKAFDEEIEQPKERLPFAEFHKS